MTIIVCGEHRYQVTTEDRLWLLRAVQVEGHVEEQVAQVLVNCFAFLHARSPGMFRTLTGLVRSYAQPVNPRWFPDGDLFEKWHARDAAKYSLIAAARRRDMHSKRNTFDQRVTASVTRALTLGPVDIPRNATDYAAAWIDASRKYQPITAPQRGVNRLWTRAAEWHGYRLEA